MVVTWSKVPSSIQPMSLLLKLTSPDKGQFSKCTLFNCAILFMLRSLQIKYVTAIIVQSLSTWTYFKLQFCYFLRHSSFFFRNNFLVTDINIRLHKSFFGHDTLHMKIKNISTKIQIINISLSFEHTMWQVMNSSGRHCLAGTESRYYSGIGWPGWTGAGMDPHGWTGNHCHSLHCKSHINVDV